MRNGLLTVLVLGALCAVPSIARPGDRGGAGTVASVVAESRQLEVEARTARLNREALRAIRGLNLDAERLGLCADDSMSRDPRGMRVDLEVPQNCGDELRDLQNSVVEVGTELRACGAINMRVIRQFDATRDAVRALRLATGNHGGRGAIECVAVDRGFEEHPGGHVGRAMNVERAERVALMSCQRFHDRCNIRRCRTLR